MPESAVAFDFDGVIGDTQQLAFEASAAILRLFDEASLTLESRADQVREFGYSALVSRFGAQAAPVIAGLHPVVVRERARHQPPRLFSQVLEVVAEQPCHPPIITAGYAETVQAALGDQERLFGVILGKEHGDKLDLLRAQCRPGSVFFTDTVTDVRRCLEANLVPIGVGWGYDSASQLVEAGAAEVALDVGALRAILSQALARVEPRGHIRQRGA